MRKHIYNFICLLFTVGFVVTNSFSQTQEPEYFPGGVAGAEMWFIIDHDELASTFLKNNSTDYNYIILKSCGQQSWQNTLFNYNPSITTNELCFFYKGHLENTTSRNVFFVGEPNQPIPNQPEEIYSHISTNWKSDYSSLYSNDITVENRFDFSDKNGLIDKNVLTYNSNNNAYINFYKWNIYQLNKKLRSYGLEGETEFSIGKLYQNPPNQSENIPEVSAAYFAGNFPEFISFPFELTYNQRNRVESYLALKYGITLIQNGSTNYRNSKNIVFWNKDNAQFWNRIFGIGRDDISGLNQLQSESSHFKDYLIASVNGLAASNIVKQQEPVIVENNNFIVFGDNGGNDFLMPVNDFDVRPLQKIWLSQNTGEHASVIPIFFKIGLIQAIKTAMSQNSTLKLWMLHDKYVNNTEISDFNSQYVDYYEAASLDGLDYGFFEDVFFDTDEMIYDQFTFGVGPEMIVQVRFDQDCDDERVRSNIVITGGKEPYQVTIENTNNYSEVFTINENTMTFEAIAPDTYTVSVIDAEANEADTEVEVILQQVNVDFGQDEFILSQNLQEVTLDAGQNVSDANATYKWYFNDELIEHFDSVLIVSEPGIYRVEVMSANQMCEDWDEVTLLYSFTATAVAEAICGEDTGTITFTLDGGVTSGSGVDSYTVHIHNQGADVTTDIFTASNIENIVVNGVSYGNNIVTIQDAVGNEVVLNVEVVSPLNGIELDLISQLNNQCTPVQGPDYPLYNCPGAEINGALEVVNPNVSYEWYLNGEPTGITDPYVQIYIDEDNQYPIGTGYIEYKLLITNLNNGCTINDSFGLQKNTYIRGISPPQTGLSVAQEPQQEEQQHVADNVEARIIKAMVYPNPVAHSTTFYYEITSDNVFNGTIEVYSSTGAILHRENVEGKSTYTLPLRLLSSGSYLIRATTSEGILTNQVIIK